MLRRILPGRHTTRDVQMYLLQNLSFVLHERSTNDAVRDAARRSLAHAAHFGAHKEAVRHLHVATRSIPESAPQSATWLTATLGAPSRLADALRQSFDAPATIYFIDEPPNTDAPFFRAPARLRLPVDDVGMVGVAACVVRPGGRSLHLQVTGMFDWPRDRTAALRALEGLIQAYSDQWMPPRPLWTDAAEVLLSGEIG